MYNYNYSYQPHEGNDDSDDDDKTPPQIDEWNNIDDVVDDTQSDIQIQYVNDDEYDINYYDYTRPLTEERIKELNEHLRKCADNDDIKEVYNDLDMGANDWKKAFECAIDNDDIELLERTIENGQDNWNDGLEHAVWSEHVNLIQYFIDKGATNIKKEWTNAYKYNHKKALSVLEKYVRL